MSQSTFCIISYFIEWYEAFTVKILITQAFECDK